jgi:hypothetical protein
LTEGTKKWRAASLVLGADAFQPLTSTHAPWVRLNAEAPKMPPSKELMNYLEDLLPPDPTGKLTNKEKPYNVALKTLMDPSGCAGDEMCAADALSAHANGGAAASGAVGSDSGSARLDFLEASPYYDTSKVPLNTYKAKEPFVGKINSVKRIVGPKATGEICHVNIDRKVWLVFTVTHSVHYIFLNLSSLWRIILAGCNQL